MRGNGCAGLLRRRGDMEGWTFAAYLATHGFRSYINHGDPGVESQIDEAVARIRLRRLGEGRTLREIRAEERAVENQIRFINRGGRK